MDVALQNIQLSRRNVSWIFTCYCSSTLQYVSWKRCHTPGLLGDFEDNIINIRIFWADVCVCVFVWWCFLQWPLNPLSMFGLNCLFFLETPHTVVISCLQLFCSSYRSNNTHKSKTLVQVETCSPSGQKDARPKAQR